VQQAVLHTVNKVSEEIVYIPTYVRYLYHMIRYTYGIYVCMYVCSMYQYHHRVKIYCRSLLYGSTVRTVCMYVCILYTFCIMYVHCPGTVLRKKNREGWSLYDIRPMLKRIRSGRNTVSTLPTLFWTFWKWLKPSLNPRLCVVLLQYIHTIVNCIHHKKNNDS
jgi:hypothetical protein